MSRESFWARLARHREDVLGISQDEVASRLHISQQRVSELEKSTNVPDRVQRLREIGVAYGLDPAVVFAWAAEATRMDARQARRETADVRKQYDAALVEMRQVVEVNRDINDQIGRDIAEIRNLFSQLREALGQILEAVNHLREPPGPA